MTLRRALGHMITCVLVGVLVGGCAQKPVQARSAHIRFYTINNNNQLTELSLIPNRDESGCHNFPLDLKIHRVAQVGFKHCALYQSDGCLDDAMLTMKWSGKRSLTDAHKNEPTTTITPGSLWLFDQHREITVASWYCTPQA